MSRLYYYVQERGFVGDCALWWGKNRRGYVCNLSEAGLYTADEVLGMRLTDIGWPQEFVEQRVVRHVSKESLPLPRGCTFNPLGDGPVRGRWK